MYKFYANPGKKSEYIFVIQTNNLFTGISDVCLNTFTPHVLAKGYDLVVIDYTLHPNRNYFEILQDFFNTHDYDRVILSFDDLYFTYLNLIPITNLRSFIDKCDYDYIRLNARPHGNPRTHIGTYGGYKFLEPKQGRYMYSTVLSALSQTAVQKIIKHGISTPWQLETCDQDIMSAAVVQSTSARFLNTVVKGKIDVCAIAQISNLRVSVLGMFIRLLRRIYLVDIIFSNISIYKGRFKGR